MSRTPRKVEAVDAPTSGQLFAMWSMVDELVRQVLPAKLRTHGFPEVAQVLADLPEVDDPAYALALSHGGSMLPLYESIWSDLRVTYDRANALADELARLRAKRSIESSRRWSRALHDMGYVLGSLLPVAAAACGWARLGEVEGSGPWVGPGPTPADSHRRVMRECQERMPIAGDDWLTEEIP